MKYKFKELEELQEGHFYEMYCLKYQGNKTIYKEIVLYKGNGLFRNIVNGELFKTDNETVMYEMAFNKKGYFYNPIGFNEAIFTSFHLEKIGFLQQQNGIYRLELFSPLFLIYQFMGNIFSIIVNEKELESNSLTLEDLSRIKKEIAEKGGITISILDIISTRIEEMKISKIQTINDLFEQLEAKGVKFSEEEKEKIVVKGISNEENKLYGK